MSTTPEDYDQPPEERAFDEWYEERFGGATDEGALARHHEALEAWLERARRDEAAARR